MNEDSPSPPKRKCSRHDTIPLKKLKNIKINNIVDLPNDILLNIFEKLPPEEVILNVALVCRRFKDTTSLINWTKIDVSDNISRAKLCEWISAAPNLEYLILRDRDDKYEDIYEIMRTLYHTCQHNVTLHGFFNDQELFMKTIWPRAWFEKTGVLWNSKEYQYLNFKMFPSDYY